MAELTEVQEVVADVAEEVADQASNIAEVSRRLSGREVRLLFSGVGVGGVVAGLAGYYVAMRRLETKYNKIAEEEISEMRELFQARMIARESKPDLSELTERTADLGYSSPNPPKEDADSESVVAKITGERMAEEEDPEEEDEAIVSGPALADPTDTVQNVFDMDSGKDPNEDWDYEEEVRLRRPDRPYIIHEDERGETELEETTFVYYVGDDVLCNELDQVLEDKDAIVGVENLSKFGHGSGSKDILFIRNVALGMEIEIARNEGYFAEIVHGFVQHEEGYMRRRRRHLDDE